MNEYETPIGRWWDLQQTREIEQRTGLKFTGHARLGLRDSFNWYSCTDCGLDYPDMGNGPQANGKVLERCLCKAEG